MSRVDRAAAGILILAVVVVYWSSFQGRFILDDNASIVENPKIQGEGALIGALLPPEQSADAPRWRGPVVAFTLALNHAQAGLEPRGYHVFNLVVHLLATLLFFSIVLRSLLLPPLHDRFATSATNLALAAALIWSVHPLLTDAVTYVIQRTTLLVGLFYLGTLALTLQGARSARPGRWFAGAVICCLLGMLSKESMVTAPVMVALYDRVFLSTSWRESWTKRRSLYLGLAATWLGLVWLIAVSPHQGNIGLDLHVGPFDYLLAQTEVIVHYLKLVFWPRELILDYGLAHPVSIAAAALPGLFLLALLAATVVAFRSHPRVAFLGAWFFITLSPTSSIVPIALEVGAERRMYLPLMAIALLVVLAGHWLLERLAIRRDWSRQTVRTIAVVLVAGMTIILGALTVQRNLEYHAPLALWRDTVEKVPDNPRAHNGLGVALVRDGRPDEAVAAYQQAVMHRPNYPEAHYNLGRALARIGRHGEAAAAYEQAVTLDPTDFKAHNNLGNALLRLGRAEEAEAHFREVVRLDPGSALGYNGLGLSLAGQGKLDEALACYERAIVLRPGYAQAMFNAGLVLEARGDTTGAAGYYRRALRVEPGHAAARGRLDALDGAPDG